MIVIYGPPATGKTRHAEELRQHYQCTRIIDLEGDWLKTTPKPDDLILFTGTQQQIEAHVHHFPGARYVPIWDALQEIGQHDTSKTPGSDRFRKLVERIAAWTDEELTAVDARQCRHVAQVVAAGADPIYPPFGPSAFAAPSIPEGMKRWTGGDRAPADWDAGAVWLRAGRLSKKGEGPKADADGQWIEGDGNWHHLNGWDWDNQVAIPGEWDVIAYTPKTATTADLPAPFAEPAA